MELQDKAQYRKRLGYVNYLTVLFMLISGMKALSGECVTFFSDRLIHDLNFTTSQYSSMTALFYLSYGVATIVIGTLTGRSRKRKAWLFPMTLMAGVFAVLASMTNSYAGLAACRFGTGIFTGSSTAIMLNIISKNLVREDYGTRNGIINGGSTVISSIFGPVILATLTMYYRWNAAFLLTGSVLVLLSVLVLTTVREVECDIRKPVGTNKLKNYLSFLQDLFRNRVFRLCFIIGLLETTANISLGIFTPLYYSEIMGFDTIEKAGFMSLRGMCTIPIALMIPVLADRLPVRKVMAGTFAFAAVAPAATFLLTGTGLSAYLLALFGTWAGATVTLFTYMIPRIALPENLYMQGSGLILGTSVLLGGSFAPQIMSGLIESGWEIPLVLGLCASLFVICVVLSLFVNLDREKHPEQA